MQASSIKASEEEGWGRGNGGWEMSHGCGAEPGTPRLSLGAGIEARGQLDAQAGGPTGAGEGSQ